MAPTREGLLSKILSKSLPPLSWQNPATRQNLESIVHKATAKDPDERYQSADEFAADLQNYLDGKPVTALPYRYKFDHREMVLARPAEIMVAAFWCFFAAVGIVIFGLSAMWADAFNDALHWYHPGPLVIFGTLVSFSIGWGLLSGHRWARWGGVGYCLFVYATWFAAVFRFSMAQWAVWLRSNEFFLQFLLTIGWTVVLVILLRRRTRDWIALAHRLRSEYAQQKPED
jgi:hypothetical protein